MGEVYIDGDWVPKEQARVSVFDHGFLYGDGVFEGIRAYGGRVFRLAEHVDRLYESARSIMLAPPLEPQAMRDVVVESCRRNGLRDAYVRLVVSRGPGDLGLDPRKCPRPTVICIADTITLYPPEMYENGLRLMTVPTRRNQAETVNPRIKSLNYLNNILAKMEGSLAGYPEVLLLSQEGYVTECSGDNVFIVKRGELFTPPIHLGILEGITRNAVIELARAASIPVSEAVFTRHDLWNAEGCFLTGTGAELIPVVECDGRQIADGRPSPIYRQLLAAFRRLVGDEGVRIYDELATGRDR